MASNAPPRPHCVDLDESLRNEDGAEPGSTNASDISVSGAEEWSERGPWTKHHMTSSAESISYLRDKGDSNGSSVEERDGKGRRRPTVKLSWQSAETSSQRRTEKEAKDDPSIGATTTHTSFGSLLGIARKTPQTTRAGVVPARPLAKSAGHLTLSGSGDQHVLSPAEKKLQQDEEELTEMTRSFEEADKFIDYYALVGIDDMLIPDTGDISEAADTTPIPKSVPSPRNSRTEEDVWSALRDIDFKPKLMDRYPAVNNSNAALPPHIWMFCFPNGMRLRRTSIVDASSGPVLKPRSNSTCSAVQRRSDTMLRFVLTEMDGTRFFCVALLFYEPARKGLVEEFIEHRFGTVLPPSSSEETDEKDPSSSVSARKYTYMVPKAICLVSRYGYFQVMGRAARELFRCQLPLEHLVHRLTKEVIVPPPGFRSIFSLGMLKDARSLSIHCHHPYTLPQEESSIFRLLQRFGPSKLISLVEALLSEEKIIFHSFDYALLTSAADALVSLLFPFHWYHVFIPVLPQWLLQFSQAPTPYIMGMHNLMYEEKYLKLRGEEGEEMFGDIVDVHLDEGIIQFQGQSGVSSEWSVDDTDGDCSDHSVPRRRSRLSTSFGIEAEVGDDDDTIDATSSSSSSSTMAGLEPKLPPAVRKSLEKRLERILEQRAESTASSSYESVTESESEEGNDRTEDEAVSTPSKAAGCDCFSSGIGRLDLCVRTAFLQEIFVRFFHGYKQYTSFLRKFPEPIAVFDKVRFVRELNLDDGTLDFGSISKQKEHKAAARFVERFVETQSFTMFINSHRHTGGVPLFDYLCQLREATLSLSSEFRGQYLVEFQEQIMMSNSRGYEVHVFPEQWQKLQSRSGSNLRRKAAVKLEHYSDVKTSFPRLESSLMALAEQSCNSCLRRREDFPPWLQWNNSCMSRSSVQTVADFRELLPIITVDKKAIFDPHKLPQHLRPGVRQSIDEFNWKQKKSQRNSVKVREAAGLSFMRDRIAEVRSGQAVSSPNLSLLKDMLKLSDGRLLFVVNLKPTDKQEVVLSKSSFELLSDLCVNFLDEADAHRDFEAPLQLLPISTEYHYVDQATKLTKLLQSSLKGHVFWRNKSFWERLFFHRLQRARAKVPPPSSSPSPLSISSSPFRPSFSSTMTPLHQSQDSTAAWKHSEATLPSPLVNNKTVTLLSTTTTTTLQTTPSLCRSSNCPQSSTSPLTLTRHRRIRPLSASVHPKGENETSSSSDSSAANSSPSSSSSSSLPAVPSEMDTAHSIAPPRRRATLSREVKEAEEIDWHRLSDTAQERCIEEEEEMLFDCFSTLSMDMLTLGLMYDHVVRFITDLSQLAELSEEKMDTLQTLMENVVRVNRLAVSDVIITFKQHDRSASSSSRSSSKKRKHRHHNDSSLSRHKDEGTAARKRVATEGKTVSICKKDENQKHMQRWSASNAPSASSSHYSSSHTGGEEREDSQDNAPLLDDFARGYGTSLEAQAANGLTREIYQRLMEYQRTDLRRRKVAREGLQEVLRYSHLLERNALVLTHRRTSTINAQPRRLLSNVVHEVVKEERDGFSVATLKAHERSVDVIEMDQSIIVSGGADGQILVWDSRSGVCYRQLPGHSSKITSLAFDEDHIVSGGVDCDVKVWDTQTGSFISSVTAHTATITRVLMANRVIDASASEDQQQTPAPSTDILTASYDHTMKMWDLRHMRGKPTAEFSGHTGPVMTCVWDENLIISGSRDTTIKVWDRRMHRLIALLMEHSDWVSQLVLCRGGEADTAPLSSLSSSSSSLWLASGSFDCTVRLWDIAKLQSDYATCAFPSSPSTATTRQQSPQQQHLQHSPQRVNPHSPSRSTAIKNRSIFASSTAALARRNNMAMLKKSSASTLIPRAAYVLEGHNGSINDIQMQYHKSGGWRVLSASGDGTARIWQVHDGEFHSSRILRGHDGEVVGCRWLSDGRVVTASHDKTVCLWSNEDKYSSVATVLRGHGDWITSLRVHRNRVVTSSLDSTVRIWDLNSRAVTPTVPPTASSSSAKRPAKILNKLLSSAK